jgi:hypothetical protein
MILFGSINFSRVTKKHRRALEAIFHRPTLASIRWADFVGMVKVLGGTVEERAGSHVAFVMSGRVYIAHKPHPGNELRKCQAEDARKWLASLGVEP